MKRFKPTYIIPSVAEIPFVLLERDNIKGLIFDVDNTITTMGKGVTEKSYKWIMEAKSLGYKVCILSNSINVAKVKKVMKDLDVMGLYCARKPNIKGYQMALDLLDLKKEEVIMIGDQVFTDILGANRFGIKSILVNRISKKEGPSTLIKRPLERYVLNKLSEVKDD